MVFGPLVVQMGKTSGPGVRVDDQGSVDVKESESDEVGDSGVVQIACGQEKMMGVTQSTALKLRKNVNFLPMPINGTVLKEN